MRVGPECPGLMDSGLTSFGKAGDYNRHCAAASPFQKRTELRKSNALAKRQITNYGFFISRNTRINARMARIIAIQMWIRFPESLAMIYSAIAATDDAENPKTRIMECIISPF